MTHRRFNLIVMLLALGGVMFSGYLSAVKFFSGNCAFGESCPIFFGQPACYYGLAIFVAMFLPNVYAYLNHCDKTGRIWLNLALSALGTLYALAMLWVEVSTWGFQLYGLGLPTCLYGALFFIGILVFTLIARKKIAKTPAAPVTSAV